MLGMAELDYCTGGEGSFPVPGITPQPAAGGPQQRRTRCGLSRSSRLAQLQRKPVRRERLMCPRCGGPIIATIYEPTCLHCGWADYGVVDQSQPAEPEQSYVCAYCGEPFTPCRRWHRTQRYCSRRCLGMSRRK